MKNHPRRDSRTIRRDLSAGSVMSPEQAAKPTIGKAVPRAMKTYCILSKLLYNDRMNSTESGDAL